MQTHHPDRVSKQHPCPICGKHDWCMVGKTAVICMRVASDKPKNFSDGSSGWLHPLDSAPAPRPVREERPAPVLNVAKILESWSQYWRGDRLDKLCCSLGVTPRSLEMLGCIHSPYVDTWAFPMRDGLNNYVGIRLRRINGDKWAERGSHQGLFIPQTEPQATALIVEGPTDCAAALSIGCFAIGRPNCCGGIDQLKVVVNKLGIRRAVIVSDLDDPGLRGANTLREHLDIPTAILVTPAKDLRQAVNAGMDRPMLDAMLEQLIWSGGRNA